MRCYFLRHGTAADAATWPGADADRPLTDKGQARIERLASALAALEPAFDAIVTSPLLRAKQTATIVAKALRQRERLVEDPRLGAGFGPAALADVLADHRGAGALLLVGHEPGMSQTIGRLIGGAELAFKPGSLACVDLPDPSTARGSLVWLVPAKVLGLKGRRA